MNRRKGNAFRSREEQNFLKALRNSVQEKSFYTSANKSIRDSKIRFSRNREDPREAFLTQRQSIRGSAQKSGSRGKTNYSVQSVREKKKNEQSSLTNYKVTPKRIFEGLKYAQDGLKRNKKLRVKLNNQKTRNKNLGESETTPNYIKGEIYFNPRSMSQLRIRQFTSVQTATAELGRNREVKISSRLLEALNEQAKSERGRKYKNFTKFTKRDLNPINHSSLANEVSESKIKRYQKLYKSNMTNATDHKKYVNDMVHSMANF